MDGGFPVSGFCMERDPHNYFYRAEWNQGYYQFRVEWDQEYDFFCGKRD